ncbi:MAG: glycoside hydrolase family 2 protein [Cyanobium sp.]
MKAIALAAALACLVPQLMAQSFMLNPYGCPDAVSLNGKWNAIVDPYSSGESMKYYLNRKPEKKSEFLEYSFDGGLQLNVPGDFNSQVPELKYYEGNVWYQRSFEAQKKEGRRQYLYFAGVSYETKVWLNGVEVGRHEGGFTPFQFDITDQVKDGVNDLVVLVNNDRRPDGIPAMSFDWWNYGGILRDVFFLDRPAVHIRDYKVQLTPDRKGIAGYIQLEGADSPQEVTLAIEGLDVRHTLTTDDKGFGSFELKAAPELWMPGNPKLYPVKISTGQDRIDDEIGFRTVSVKETEILLNGEPVFLKGVNFHEEVPQRLGRAHSEADAAMILGEVKALGCNFIRTSHYPQNEHIVRAAERMGLMIWEEIPIWQGIDFTNAEVFKKAETMLRDMIYRDKNRAAVIIWSVANETKPSEARDKMLVRLVDLCHELDRTRLVAAAFDNPRYDGATKTFRLEDKLAEAVDVVGVNKYLGWYTPFPLPPAEIKWDVAASKPLIFSEFGAEALSGKRGPDDVAHEWSEDYQAAVYRQNLEMFRNIPNLRGTAPWVLFDFRSPYRRQQTYQNGWNRKGLLGDKGQRKMAWQVMKHFHDTK